MQLVRGDQVRGQVLGRVGDDRDGGHRGATLHSPPLSTVLVTGATGLVGLARRPPARRARRSRARDGARPLAPGQPRRPRRRAGDVRRARPPRGPPRAQGRRQRLPHRGPDLAARLARHALPRERHRARGRCSRRRCGPASRGRSTRRRSPRSGRPSAARPPTSASRSSRAASTSPTSTPSARRRPRRCASPPRGLPVVIVNPAHVFGAGDLYRSSTELVLRFLRRQIPAYVDGALNVVDAEDVARGHLLAEERGRPGERYILGNRNFTLDRLLADLGRISGVAPPALKLNVHAALALARGARGAARPARRSRSPRCGPRRSGGPTAARRPSASWAGSRRTTRTRWSARSPGTATAATAGLVRPGTGQPIGAAPGRLRGAPHRCGRRPVTPLMATLYRCRTPTNWLCPCGRVARELQAAGRGRRRGPRAVAQARPRRGLRALRPGRTCRCSCSAARPICDSHRIVEHLRWRAEQAAH